MRTLEMREVQLVSGGAIDTGGEFAAAVIVAFGAGLMGLAAGPGGFVFGAGLGFKAMEAVM